MLLTTSYLLWRAWTKPGSLNPIPVALLALGLAGAAVASPREHTPHEPLSLREWVAGFISKVAIAYRLAATGAKPVPEAVSR